MSDAGELSTADVQECCNAAQTAYQLLKSQMTSFKAMGAFAMLLQNLVKERKISIFEAKQLLVSACVAQLAGYNDPTKGERHD